MHTKDETIEEYGKMVHPPCCPLLSGNWKAYAFRVSPFMFYCMQGGQTIIRDLCLIPNPIINGLRLPFHDIFLNSLFLNFQEASPIGRDIREKLYLNFLRRDLCGSY
jgi:hypothetical protein